MTSDLAISDLRCFAAAARTGSMSRAALTLGVSQPTVSQRIQRLERAVGGLVLTRNTQGATLTPAGERLLVYAERLLSLHEQARASVGEEERSSEGPRSVGLLEDLAITALPAALGDFGALHPRVSLDVVIAPAATLRRRADRGLLDIAVGDPGVMREGAVRIHQTAELVWTAAATLDPLSDPLPLVMFSPPCSWRQPVLDAVSRSGRQWRIAFQSNSTHAVQAALSAGVGASAMLEGNIPPGCVRLSGRHGFPAPLTVDIAVTRRPGPDDDPVLDDLEAVLRRALFGSHSM
jgi:DNA-binding transcriptional LysR family regulator